MPRRKTLIKMPDYIGVPDDQTKLVVQKSNPLKSLSETGMSLAEFKILDAYLSRIDSYYPDKRTVRFEKGELEKILGVTRILKKDLEERLNGFGHPVRIYDETKPKGFTNIWLFEIADVDQDENGLWQVDLKCTPAAMEYIFNLDNLGYLKYRLRNVINLTSRYSYVLFLYLIDKDYRKTWTVDLAELKELLNCTAERYNQFKFFNSEILKKCHNELCEKTNLSYDYKPIKNGRIVYAIEFTVNSFNDKFKDQMHNEPLESNHTAEKNPVIDFGSDLANMLDKACNGEFSAKQVLKLEKLICDFLPDADNTVRYNYLCDMVRKMDNYSPDQSRFGYLRTMIEKDKGKSARSMPSYDLGEYEKFARKYEFSDAPWNVETENNK